MLDTLCVVHAQYTRHYSVLLNVLVTLCRTICLVFYMLLNKFDILRVIQWTLVLLKLRKLDAVMLPDQVNRHLSS